MARGFGGVWGYWSGRSKLTCELCGRSKLRTLRSVFCSAACKQKAYRQRNGLVKGSGKRGIIAPKSDVL